MQPRTPLRFKDKNSLNVAFSTTLTHFYRWFTERPRVDISQNVSGHELLKNCNEWDKKRANNSYAKKKRTCIFQKCMVIIFDNDNLTGIKSKLPVPNIKIS